jgi:hypothetical protein
VELSAAENRTSRDPDTMLKLGVTSFLLNIPVRDLECGGVIVSGVRVVRWGVGTVVPFERQINSGQEGEKNKNAEGKYGTSHTYGTVPPPRSLHWLRERASVCTITVTRILTHTRSRTTRPVTSTPTLNSLQYHTQ